MNPGRIPSLDGLRALSITLVVIGHAYQGFAPEQSSSWPALILGNAGLGVEVFFVISGYLITTLLLDEQERSGRLSLSSFYTRRAFRIVPALWVFVAVVFVLSQLGAVGGVDRCSILSAVTFTTNYSPCVISEALIHTWSLSVEEQFYLIWPVTLILGWRVGGRRLALAIAVGLVLASPALRLATFALGGDQVSSRIYYMLHTRLDALMFGCAAALAIGEPWFEATYRRLAPFALPAFAAVLVLSPLAVQAWGGAYLYVAGYTIEGAAITMAMLWLIRSPASATGRLLNWRPVVYLGTLSYSLYLWQTLFLKTDIAVSRWPAAAVAVSLLAAAASYHLIEKPFLRLRRRFAGRPTSGLPIAPSRPAPSA